MQYLDVIKSWLYDLLETITSCVHLHRWPPLYKPNETLWNRSHFLIIICICNIRTLIMDVLTFYFNWISFPVGFGLSGVQPVTSLQITSSHRSLKLDIQNAKSDSSKIKIYYVDWDVYMLLYPLDSSDFFYSYVPLPGLSEGFLSLFKKPVYLRFCQFLNLVLYANKINCV